MERVELQALLEDHEAMGVGQHQVRRDLGSAEIRFGNRFGEMSYCVGCSVDETDGVNDTSEVKRRHERRNERCR